ncbi:MAG: hypothetical protein GXO40_00330 [Epsilonproteobacteria bacterium]|nr:hypothetical protein [Campylobacterota bacterium]
MKYVFAAIFTIVFISLVVVYIRISGVDITPPKQTSPLVKPKKEELSIIKLLANTPSGDLFPAKELYLKVNLDFISKTHILYQTVINNLDKYTLFGIEQILQMNNIKYSIIKLKDDLKLFVNFTDVAQAKQIQQIFKSYNFDVKLKRVKVQIQQKG